jgi:uncharacterized membrane protein YhhN
LVGEARGHLPLRAISKTGASLTFVAAALVSGAATAGTPGRGLLAALGLSVVGDVLLLSRARRLFLAGILAFLLAHVAYIGAFAAMGPSLLRLGVALVPLAALGLRVWRWVGPRTGKLGAPVLAYIVVICGMVASAAAVYDGAPSRLALLGSAVAFFLSDLCVARDRFVSPGPVNRFVGLPLYYGAQLGFAYALPWSLHTP